jgi:hypothetical protein
MARRSRTSSPSGANVALPVVAVEQLEREKPAEPDGPQEPHQLAERGDTVAWEHAVGVGDRGAGRTGRVIVHVEDTDRRAVQQRQPGEARATLVEMIDVGEYTRMLMTAFDRHQCGLAEPVQRL